MSKRTALDVYTSPSRTPYEQLAMFMAQSCFQYNTLVRQPREDDVWAALTAMAHLYVTKELKSYSRQALGMFVGLVCQLWAIMILEK